MITKVTFKIRNTLDFAGQEQSFMLLERVWIRLKSLCALCEFWSQYEELVICFQYVTCHAMDRQELHEHQ